MNCVYILPATDPSDTSFGLPDVELAALAQVANCRAEHIVFEQLVWYNAALREEVFAQIAPSCRSRSCTAGIAVGCRAIGPLERPDSIISFRSHPLTT